MVSQDKRSSTPVKNQPKSGTRSGDKAATSVLGPKPAKGQSSRPGGKRRPASEFRAEVPPPKPLWRRVGPPGLGLLLVIALVIWYLGQRDGSISGRVQDANSSESLLNAVVTVDQEAPVHINAMTGSYIFNRLRPGRHSLKAEAPGYQVRNQEIEVKPGQSDKIDLVLSPVPVADRIKGQLALIGTHNPDTVIILDSKLDTLRTVSLPAEPSDGVAIGKVLFTAHSASDRISVIDLPATQMVKEIKLPQFSGPVRLLASPDQGTLLVLNAVGKNLMLIDTTSYAIRNTIQLPIAATDMEMSSEGNVVIASGPEGMMRILYAGGSVDQPQRFVGSLDSGISLMPGTGQVLLPGGPELGVIDSVSGQFKEYTLDRPVQKVVGLDSDRVLVASEGRAFSYSLSQSQNVGESFDYQQGKAQSLSRFGSQWLLATRDPSALYLLDPATLSKSRSFAQRGQVQFVLEHQL